MTVVRTLLRTTAAASIAVLTVAAGVSTAQASTAPADDGGATFCNYDLDTQKTTCHEDAASARAGAPRGKAQLLALWGKPRGGGHAVAFFAKRGCNGDGKVYVVKDLRKVRFDLPKGQNWNNRASSLYADNGCKVMLFGKKNQRGKHTDWLKKEARLGKVHGGWNNRATSLRID